MPCVKIPNGIVCLGGDIVRIKVGTRMITFEDHHRFGPIRCYPDGEVADRAFGYRSKFWSIWERWAKQGKRVTADNIAVVD